MNVLDIQNEFNLLIIKVMNDIQKAFENVYPKKKARCFLSSIFAASPASKCRQEGGKSMLNKKQYLFMNRIAKLTGVFCLTIIFVLPLSAQKTSDWTVRWGATVGLNGYNANTLDLSDGRGRWGGHVGAKAEIFRRASRPSYDYFSVEAKLLLLRSNELLGETKDMAGQPIFYTNQTDAYYFHLPIHYGYKWSLGRNCSLLLDAGPYMAVGLAGKSRSNMAEFVTDDAGETTDVLPKKVKENTFSERRRFEAGLGVNLGVEVFKHWQAGVSYDYGLTKMSKYGNDHNANFTFFLGYMF